MLIYELLMQIPAMAMKITVASDALQCSSYMLVGVIRGFRIIWR